MPFGGLLLEESGLHLWKKWIVKARRECLREKNPFYHTQKDGFLHVYSVKGRRIIDEQTRQHEHPVMMILVA